MRTNKLDKSFDTAGWQWMDKHGHILQIDDMTRDDLLQVACACMKALEDAEEAGMKQQEIFSEWRTGRKIDA